jgi:protein involved in polysaccharide export with SLBB domain
MNFMKILLVILFATLSIFISLNSYAQEINPGDGVRISFLDIEDVITGDYYIQPNGLLSLPIIGFINTSNKDFKKIKSEIEFRYDSLYKDPHISVNALFRINVIGAVQTPGFYYVSDYEKFTAILAFAGGTNDAADLDNIVLIRNFEAIEIDVEDVIKEGSTATDFGLQSGDQVFVPRNWWADNQAWVSFAFALTGLLLTVYLVFLQE